MSEMALTADHLVVIGKGKMIADVSVEEFIRLSSHNYVRVRSPQIQVLSSLLQSNGAEVSMDQDALNVTGFECNPMECLSSRLKLVLE